MSSISTALGAGSGVDFTALTNQLVDAQFAAKTSALNKKNTQLNTQISGLGQLKSAITKKNRTVAMMVAPAAAAEGSR